MLAQSHPSIAAAARANALSCAARVRMGALACGALALLAVAAWLQPATNGMGTHTQLGIPACTWPTTLGIPCPSCGMTTAFAHAADGRFIDSFRAQPFGCLLAIATAALVMAGGYAAFTGSQLVGVLLKSVPSAGWWLLGGALLASWGFKIVESRGFFS